MKMPHYATKGSLACALGILYCISSPAFSYAQDKIVAVVNNEIVTQKDLNDFANFTRMQLAEQYQGRELDDKVKEMEPDLLNRLIEDRIILQEARKNKVEVDKNKVKARINQIKKQYASEGEFQEALARQGLVQADIEERIKEQIMMLTIVDMKVKSRVVVTPAEVTEYYQAHAQDFSTPQQCIFEYLSTNDEYVAKDLAVALRYKNDLAEAGKKFNLQVQSLIADSSGGVRKEIQEELFKLKPGEVSKPIGIDGKYYIFKLAAITPPKEQNLNDVRDRIYALLFDQKMQKAMQKWLSELRSRSYVQVFQG